MSSSEKTKYVENLKKEAEQGPVVVPNNQDDTEKSKIQERLHSNAEHLQAEAREQYNKPSLSTFDNKEIVPEFVIRQDEIEAEDNAEEKEEQQDECLDQQEIEQQQQYSDVEESEDEKQRNRPATLKRTSEKKKHFIPQCESIHKFPERTFQESRDIDLSPEEAEFRFPESTSRRMEILKGLENDLDYILTVFKGDGMRLTKQLLQKNIAKLEREISKDIMRHEYLRTLQNESCKQYAIDLENRLYNLEKQFQDSLALGLYETQYDHYWATQNEHLFEDKLTRWWRFLAKENDEPTLRTKLPTKKRSKYWFEYLVKPTKPRTTGKKNSKESFDYNDVDDPCINKESGVYADCDSDDNGSLGNNYRNNDGEPVHYEYSEEVSDSNRENETDSGNIFENNCQTESLACGDASDDEFKNIHESVSNIQSSASHEKPPVTDINNASDSKNILESVNNVQSSASHGKPPVTDISNASNGKNTIELANNGQFLTGYEKSPVTPDNKDNELVLNKTIESGDVVSSVTIGDSHLTFASDNELINQNRNSAVINETKVDKVDDKIEIKE